MYSRPVSDFLDLAPQSHTVRPNMASFSIFEFTIITVAANNIVVTVESILQKL